MKNEVMKNQVMKNVAGVILFYLVLIAGALIIDMRMDSLPDSPTQSINIAKKYQFKLIFFYAIINKE